MIGLCLCLCAYLCPLNSRLARIDIGGTKGKTLTNSVQQIHSDFEGTVVLFKTVQYDIMDVSRKEFDDDFYEFRCKIKNLEVRARGDRGAPGTVVVKAVTGHHDFPCTAPCPCSVDWRLC